MTHSVQNRGWISRMRLRGASVALASVVVLVLGAGAQSAQAQTYKLLYSFHGWDGTNPQAGLVRDTAGNLYGTAQWGGTYDNGTVYELNKKGVLTMLYSFCPNGDGCTDGAIPVGGLIRDTQGTLYGTTAGGGLSNYGVVFKLDTSGTETVLYSFAGSTTDGCIPHGNLLRDKTGNLYGTAGYCGAFGYGTVFKLATTGTETVLHSFTGSDGANPLSSLIMDKKGNFYGATAFGGDLNCYDGGVGRGCGVVYKLSKSGTLTVLHSFAGGTTDGCYPDGTPAMDKNSNLYGTTEVCGASNSGIVWQLSKKGTETVLHNFAGGSSDGAYPLAGVILDAKGHLYGDTEGGGSSSDGTVYEVSKNRKLTLLHSFVGSDGSYPFGDVIRDAKGNLYGTTNTGGNPPQIGTVWKLTP